LRRGSAIWVSPELAQSERSRVSKEPGAVQRGPQVCQVGHWHPRIGIGAFVCNGGLFLPLSLVLGVAAGMVQGPLLGLLLGAIILVIGALYGHDRAATVREIRGAWLRRFSCVPPHPETMALISEAAFEAVYRGRDRLSEGY
jgi:hypothetical protein